MVSPSRDQGRGAERSTVLLLQAAVSPGDEADRERGYEVLFGYRKLNVRSGLMVLPWGCGGDERLAFTQIF